MTEQAPEEKIENPPRSGAARLGIFLSTIAIIIFAAAFAYGYFQLAQLAKSMQNKDTGGNQAITELQNKVTSLEQAQQKSADLSEQQEKLMTEWKVAQSGDMNTWHIAEAQYLIKMANDQLQFAANTKTALALLQQAEKELQSSEDASLLEVKKSLATDIANLQALPQTDVTATFVQISTINKLVDKLPLPIQPLSSDDSEQQPVKADTSSFKGALNSVWAGLNKIVIIRKTDGNALPLVLPDEKIFLYQNLHAQLENVTWGLLHKNENIYNTSLKNVTDWIKQYFVQDAPETKNMLLQIEELQKVNVAPATMTLDNTLQLINSYFAKTKGQ